MSWQTQLKEASFKQQPFKVDTADVIFGRSISVSERPIAGLTPKNKAKQATKAATPYVLDKGLLPREFNVTAHFSGPDYITDRDNFMFAINEGGVGTLQLPLYEQIDVMAGKASVTFSNKSGGFETIKVQFVQYSATEQPKQSSNTTKAVAGGVSEGMANNIEAFALSIANGAKWVEDQATSMQEALSDSILGTLYNGAKSTLDSFETVSELALDLSNRASSLINAPSELALQISDIFENMSTAFEQPINSFNAQKALFENYSVRLPSLPSGSVSEAVAIENQINQIQIVQNALIMQMGRVASLIDYESLDEALAVQREFETLARQQQRLNGDYSGYQQQYDDLANIIALVRRHISNQADLPGVVEISYKSSNPTLIIAEDLYGDADRSSEIVNRNKVRHPLFAGTELNVLSS